MTIWVFLIFFLFILGRTYPYFQNSVPLGYDSGLYLYLFKKYSSLPFSNFTSLPKWLVETYEPAIAFLGKIISFFVGPEKFLVPLIIIFEVFLLATIYIFAKKLWGAKAALWSAFIYVCSALQFRFYWYYYLKNIAAISFLLLSFYFILTNSYLAVPFSVLVVYTHRPTAALLLATLLINLVVMKKQKKFYGIVFSATMLAAVLYYLPTFKTTILPLLSPLQKSVVPKSLGGQMGSPSGTFYGLRQTFLLSLPYLLPGVYGFWLAWRKRKDFLVITPFLVSLVIVIFRIFFWRRFVPFLDLFLILLAGYGLSKLKLKKVLVFSYAVILLIFISGYIYKTGKPLIFDDELQEIRMLRETEPEAYVLVTDEAYMPWVYGWSDRKPIAPRYGEYDIYWTIPEWHQFWESGSREVEHQLLLKLPKPLYIYSGDRQIPFAADFSGPCFEKINWRTYKFICEK